MGARGPAPESKKKLERRGSRRIGNRPDDLDLPAELPKPPANLDREAKAEWQRLVKLLGPRRVLTAGDRGSLTMLCELWSEDRTLGKQLKKLVSGSTDWKRVFVARQDVRRQLTVMWTKFGLTPADRARVKVIGTSEKNKNDRGHQTARDKALRLVS